MPNTSISHDAPTPAEPEGLVPSTVLPSKGGVPAPMLGPFRLLRILGEGGMGVVYEAEDARLNRPVALKVMQGELAGRLGSRERFLREARAAAAVPHDHIVPIHEVGEADGTPYIAMQLLRGESLEARLRREPPVPLAEVVRLGRETAEGLAAAHEKGLVHRDIKPANLWLESPGEPGRVSAGSTTARVKILDFGLAREVKAGEGLTRAGTLLGSPGYMSPEQVDGLPVDARTDLFSLGCVLYRLATGEPAFSGPTLTAVLRATAEHHPRPTHEVNTRVPAPLSGLIGRLLAKQPDDRPASARAVADELRELERVFKKATTPYGSPSTSGPQGGGSSFSWGRLGWAAGALVFLMIVGWGIALTRPREKAEGKPEPRDSAAGAVSLALDVRVWKKADTTRGLTLGEKGVLPLHEGDWMRGEVAASQPMYLYVVNLEASGEAVPLYPWRGYKWDDRPEEAKRQSLNLPEDPLKDGAPLTAGPSGIESVLVLARQESLTAEENGRLRRLLTGSAQKGQFDPLRGAVWLGDAGERFVNDLDRARPALDKAGQVADPVERLRRLVRAQLGALGEATRGVCYPFQGP